MQDRDIFINESGIHFSFTLLIFLRVALTRIAIVICEIIILKAKLQDLALWKTI